jgi:MinD superfamily P-loop ATPase
VVFERRQRKPVARTCPTCGAVNYACGMPALEAEPIEVGL